MPLKRVMSHCPEARPSRAITIGMTFFTWLMYLVHFSGVTVAQNAVIPFMSSSLVFGLTFFRK